MIASSMDDYQNALGDALEAFARSKNQLRISKNHHYFEFFQQNCVYYEFLDKNVHVSICGTDVNIWTARGDDFRFEGVDYPSLEKQQNAVFLKLDELLANMESKGSRY